MVDHVKIVLKTGSIFVGALIAGTLVRYYSNNEENYAMKMKDTDAQSF